MKWCFAILMAISVPLTAFADKTVTELPKPVSEMSYQARFALEQGPDSARVALGWNGEDASLYRACFAVHMPMHADPFIEPEVRYTVFGPSDSIISQGRVKCAHANDGFTVGLTATRPAARLSFGGRGEVFATEVPFDFTHPSGITADTGSGAKLLRHSLVVRSLDELPAIPFANIDTLAAYLRASRDPVEGLWSYLDRDMTVEQARLGQKYTLATVAGDRGNFYIIDVDNFLLKGLLTPTPFDGHFDLLWYTTDGVTLSDETSASLQVDGHVLALKFGTLGATVRFAKSR